MNTLIIPTPKPGTTPSFPSNIAIKSIKTIRLLISRSHNSSTASSPPSPSSPSTSPIPNAIYNPSRNAASPSPPNASRSNTFPTETTTRPSISPTCRHNPTVCSHHQTTYDPRNNHLLHHKYTTQYPSSSRLKKKTALLTGDTNESYTRRIRFGDSSPG